MCKRVLKGRFTDLITKASYLACHAELDSFTNVAGEHYTIRTYPDICININYLKYNINVRFGSYYISQSY